MELQLTLSFACCHCQNAVTVTLVCKGAGLTEAAEEVLAAVNIPCPSCTRVCRLLFEPLRGRVREVQPCGPAQAIPEPSRN